MQLVNDYIAYVFGKIWSANHDEEGQTLVEYGLIVALLSIAAIAVLGLLGGSINKVFNTVTDKLNSAAAP